MRAGGEIAGQEVADPGKSLLNIPALIDPPLPARPRPGAGRSLRFNFSWTLAGNVIYGGCQWLMLVSLARLGSAQMVGTFSLAQAIATPVILCGTLQLRVIQATDANARTDFGRYLALRYLTTIASAAAVLLVAMGCGYRAETLAVILIVTLSKAVESISDIYFGLLQHQEEMSRIAKSMIVKGVFSLAALAATLYMTHSLALAAVAMTMTWLLVLLAYDLLAPRFCSLDSATPVWDWPALLRLARLAFPLGITTMLASLNGSLPRYFMQHSQGTRGLGLFSALATIQSAGILVVMALGNAALPRMARAYQDLDWRGFRNTVLAFLAISIGLGAASVMPVVVAGDRVISLIFGREYGGQNQTFIWLALTAAISYCTSVFGYAAAASHRIAFQPVAYAIVLAANAAGCYWLVPVRGGLGAAIAMCVAGALGCLVYLISFAGTARELRSRSAEHALRAIFNQSTITRQAIADAPAGVI